MSREPFQSAAVPLYHPRAREGRASRDFFASAANGYSLVRMMMNELPMIKDEKIDGMTFIQAIMKPHLPYYKAIKALFPLGIIHGMAHITGGGIAGNLKRIMPQHLCANIDLSKLKILPIFKHLKLNGNISDEEMLKTFNCGAGLVIVANKRDSQRIKNHISGFYDCYEIGYVSSGKAAVEFTNRLLW